MKAALAPETLDQLFRAARTPNGWTDKLVADEVVHQLYELFKWGPTASNTCPARFVWVRSDEGKARLASVVSPPNKPKILAAPLTVIIGYDLAFAQTLPKLLSPERLPVVQGILKAHEDMIPSMAMRNGSLQAAYLMLAARALGLDCWPMSGFDNAGVDREFFADTSIQSNLLCSLGYGNPELVHPRGPRLTFDEAGWFA